jgi:hypothetical protein
VELNCQSAFRFSSERPSPKPQKKLRREARGTPLLLVSLAFPGVLVNILSKLNRDAKKGCRAALDGVVQAEFSRSIGTEKAKNLFLG